MTPFVGTEERKVMTKGIRLSELAKLDDAQLKAELANLVTDAKIGKPDGYVSALNSAIADFERQVGVSSDQLPAKLASGEIQETWEVCQLLMLIKRRARFQETTPASWVTTLRST